MIFQLPLPACLKWSRKTAKFHLLAASLIMRIGFATPAAGQGAVEMEFIDSESDETVSGRISFAKSPKKVTRPSRLLNAGGTWLVETNFPLSLANGEYKFSVSRGPEFKEMSGGFMIEPRAKDIVTVKIPRAVNMHAEHWYSGDLFTKLPSDQLNRWQKGDAIDFASTIFTPEPASINQNRSNKPSKPETASDDSANGLGGTLISQQFAWNGGSLLIHGGTGDPAAATASSKENQLVSLLQQMKSYGGKRSEFNPTNRNDVLYELMEPWQRDVPLLLATDAIESMQLLSSFNRPEQDASLSLAENSNGLNAMRGSVTLSKGKQKTQSQISVPIPHDEQIRFNDSRNHYRGVGRLTEYLYWKMLDAGFRITPTAGSGFVLDDTHVGYNRVYAFCDHTPDASVWWKSIKEGKTFVTNGPLLRTQINGRPPGSVLASYRGIPIVLDIVASLSVRDPVDYLDVVFNGQTLYSAKLEDHYQKGEFPPIEIDRSGWLVVRVVTGREAGYRMATTAPFYIEFDGKPRISKSSVSFFQEWLQLAKQAEEPSELMQPFFHDAEEFWASRAASANAE